MTESVLPTHLQDCPSVVAAAIATALALVRESRVAAECEGAKPLSPDQEHALLIVAQSAALHLAQTNPT